MCQESSEGWYPHRELQDIVGFLGFVKVDRMVFPSGVISGDQGEIWWPQTPRAVRCHSDDDDDEELGQNRHQGLVPDFLSGVMPGHGVQIFLI